MSPENFENVPARNLASGEIILLGSRQIMIQRVQSVKGMIEIRNSDGSKYLFRTGASVPRLKNS